MTRPDRQSINPQHSHSALEVLLVFLRLGLTSFGGPVAHLGYFRHEFVDKRRWLDAHAYADLTSLCQFLPGPSSSQVGIAIGIARAGYAGALAAWAGFTLPSALMLMMFASQLNHFATATGAGILHGLKLVAVAIIAQAIWQMGRTLCPDRTRVGLAVLAAVVASFLPGSLTQAGIMLASALAGMAFLKHPPPLPHLSLQSGLSWRSGLVALGLLAGLLVLLPVASQLTHNHLIELIDRFFRAGSLVFGGGHVVLPLLQAAVVTPGWVSNTTFLAGYGAAQAVPGPLFSFAVWLGATEQPAPTGWAGGMVCLLAIFLPAFLLIIGVLPFWERLRNQTLARRAMMGVNAGVVGMLLAAFYQPVWTGSVHNGTDFGISLGLFLLLVVWQRPPWQIVALGSLAGLLIRF